MEHNVNGDEELWDFLISMTTSVGLVMVGMLCMRGEARHTMKVNKETQTDDKLDRGLVWLAKYGEVVHYDRNCEGLLLARHAVTGRRLCARCAP